MTSLGERSPGDPIRVEVTKWGDRPHWQFAGIWLGSDEHGEWLGFPCGTHNSRPGFEFDSEVDSVTLVPPDAFYLATLHAAGIWCDLYVDIATPATWDGDVLRSTDLDLDVIRMAPVPPVGLPAPFGLTAGWGELFIDDEDEFLEHQVTYGYPEDVIAAARASADGVKAAVEAGAAPYDGSHLRWLARLADAQG